MRARDVNRLPRLVAVAPPRCFISLVADCSAAGGCLRVGEPVEEIRRKASTYLEITTPGFMWSVLTQYAVQQPKSTGVVLDVDQLAELAGLPPTKLDDEGFRAQLRHILRVAAKNPGMVQGWRIVRDQRTSEFRLVCTRVDMAPAHARDAIAAT